HLDVAAGVLERGDDVVVVVAIDDRVRIVAGGDGGSAGDRGIRRIGDRQRLTTGGQEGGAEDAEAGAERGIRRQEREGSAAAEADRAGVAGGGVVESVEGSDGEADGRPGKGAGRRRDGEVAGARRLHGNRGAALDGRRDDVAGSQRLRPR